MYRNFYHLQCDPFGLTADPGFLYMTGEHREALAGLVYSVQTRPGLTLLTGEAGTGKTTLLRALLSFLESGNWQIALCDNPTLSKSEFHDLILARLGVQCASPMKSRQVMALQEALLKGRAEGRFFLLVVDEAQKLPLELLEEVRLLMNLETPQEKLLQIIMAGQSELLDTMRLPELRQLKQRISCYCRLKPLSQSELKEYIAHRLKRAGLPQQNLFADSAIQAIHQYTGGIPRVVNNVCDNALRTGFPMQAREITAAIIEETAADLELLPNAGLGQPPEQPVMRPQDSARPRIETRNGKINVVPSHPPQIHPSSPLNSQGPNHALARPSLEKIPLESYSNRQGSFRFLADLARRWK